MLDCSCTNACALNGLPGPMRHWFTGFTHSLTHPWIDKPSQFVTWARRNQNIIRKAKINVKRNSQTQTVFFISNAIYSGVVSGHSSSIHGFQQSVHIYFPYSESDCGTLTQLSGERKYCKTFGQRQIPWNLLGRAGKRFSTVQSPFIPHLCGSTQWLRPCKGHGEQSDIFTNSSRPSQNCFVLSLGEGPAFAWQRYYCIH